jgi:hypothetical protein
MRLHMMPQGFVVAMRGWALGGRPAAPWQTVAETGCWLVVSRWGAMGEFLSIGHAGVPTASGLPPVGLTPEASCLGLLGPGGPANGGPARFLLQARAPHGIPLAGRFLAASGVARLDVRRGVLGLTLLARFAPRRGSTWTAGVWRIEAARVPWIGEALDGG